MSLPKPPLSLDNYVAPESPMQLSLPKPRLQREVEDRGTPQPPPVDYVAQFRSNLRSVSINKTERAAPQIIGVKNVAIVESSVKSDMTNLASNSLTITADTTTYPDRAVLTIENGRGFDVYLTALSIHGQRVMRYEGALINDKLKRDDDIRRNGERKMELANQYIVNGPAGNVTTQVDKLADFWFRYYQVPKHIYTITIKGFAPWYEVGEWYNLHIGQADSIEYIDSVVECYSVEAERTAGGIGQTVCMFREVLQDWQKTIKYVARAVLGGSPKRRASRSNNITVASSTYDGPYDYRCDGTDDDVEIQAAIDYVSQTFGGGTVELTEGTFTIGAVITMQAGIMLKGKGVSTIIKTSLSAPDGFIYTKGKDGVSISDLAIDGESKTASAVNYGIQIYQDSGESVSISGINVRNIKSSDTAYGILCYRNLTPFAGVVVIDKCHIENIDGGSSEGMGGIGILGAVRCNLNTIDNVSGYYAWGIGQSNKCQNNTVLNCSTKYPDSYADSGTANACADTASGGYNS